jgi:hypothetical protein
MGKFELEAKDETTGILEEGDGILRRMIGRLKGVFCVASFSIVLLGVLAAT